MLNSNFYHGLSSNEWKQVKKQGHFNLRCDTGRWLAMRGVYLFRDNPVLAYKWAIRKQNETQELPPTPNTPSAAINNTVILKVKLKKIIPKSKILDLTTDKGMNMLVHGHRRFKTLVYEHFNDVINAKRRANSADQDIYDSSFKNKFMLTQFLLNGFSETEMNDAITKTASELSTRKVKDIQHIFEQFLHSVAENGHQTDFNFDCAVITLLVLKYKYLLVIAAIQEGCSFNERIHEHKFRSPFTKGYMGIRSQDHIEVCVTDPNVIEWCPRQFKGPNHKNYHTEYWNAATDYSGHLGENS